VDEAKIWFKLSATDSKGSIASGRHARFVVDNARFRSGLERHPGAASTGERDEIRYS
jgi:predicted thioesterase